MYITQIGNINFNVNVNAILLYLFFLLKCPKVIQPRIHKALQKNWNILQRNADQRK